MRPIYKTQLRTIRDLVIAVEQLKRYYGDAWRTACDDKLDIFNGTYERDDGTYERDAYVVFQINADVDEGASIHEIVAAEKNIHINVRKEEDND
jgi:hypothetical protein